MDWKDALLDIVKDSGLRPSKNTPVQGTARESIPTSVSVAKPLLTLRPARQPNWPQSHVSIGSGMFRSQLLVVAQICW